MNTHKNARMTFHGRVLPVKRVRERGWRVADAAHAAGVSKRAAYTWLARHRAGGEPALHDRSPAPARRRHRLQDEIADGVERLRRERPSGPAIARALGLPRSTVGAVLLRLGLGRLEALDEKPPIVRVERETPGELIHMDTKKLARIDAVGHRITGDPRDSVRGAGHEVVHVARGPREGGDHSRVAVTGILPGETPGETKESAIAFLIQTVASYKSLGVAVDRVMTGNGSRHRSKASGEPARRSA